VPIALNIGLSKEIYPADGSQVSCDIEVKIDVESLQDIDDFNRTVEQAFYACGQAINDELERQRASEASLNASAHNGYRYHSSN